MRRSRPTLPGPGAERHNDAAGSFSFVSVAVAVFAFLTLISAMAGYYSKDDEAVVAFVVTSYLDLSLLICSLWYYKSTAEGGSAPSKKRRASSVWALTTLLTFCFAFMVGKAGLNLHLALLVWFIGAETGIAAYSAFFEQQGQGSNPSGPQGIPLFSDNSKFFWVFVGALLGVITLNSGMAIYHSKDDRAIVAFVAISWTGLVLLFTFLCLYNKAAAGSPRRNRLTALLWALTTLLTFAFCYVIMGMAGLTLPLALLIWAIAVATGIGAFSVFFE